MDMRFTLAAAALAALAGAAPASASILTNASFEAPGGDSVRNQLVGASDIPGWTYDVGAGSFDVYESDDQDGLTAADGNHYVSFGHDGFVGGSLSQSFKTVAGGSYTLSYSVAEQQGDDPSQVFRATITDGTSTYSVDNSALTLSFLAGTPISFTAAGTSATLTFLDATPVGGGGGSNLALDAAAISGPEAGGVPEPASWALMLTGFGAMGAVIRRRRDAGRASLI